VSYKDNILFREKKNIGTNIQSVRDGLPRDAPSLPAYKPSSEEGEALAAADAAQRTDALSDEINLDDAQLLLNGELSSFDEDELRARVRKMQEKLTRVNQTLKDIENNKEST
jgi:di/tripeptidase